jgi:hypothetical protein
VREAAAGSGEGLPVRRGQPAAERAGRGDRHLLAEQRPDRQFVAIHVAGGAAPGTRPRQRAEERVGTQEVRYRDRVRVQVEQPPGPLHGDADVAQIAELEVAFDVGRQRAQGEQARSVREKDCPPVRPVRDLLHAGDRAFAEEAEQPRPVERRAERQAQPDYAGRRGGASPAVFPRPTGPDRPPGQPRPTPRPTSRHAPRGTLAQHRRRRVEHLQDRRVELADAGESGGERYVPHRQRSCLDQHSGRLRPLRPCQRERPGTQFGDQQPPDLSLLVTELG